MGTSSHCGPTVEKGTAWLRAAARWASAGALPGEDTCATLVRMLRCAAAAVAAALLLVASGVSADALRFEGDLPDAPHVLIDLTEAQRVELRRAPSHGERWPQLLLTQSQRDVL